MPQMSPAKQRLLGGVVPLGGHGATLTRAHIKAIGMGRSEADTHRVSSSEGSIGSSIGSSIPRAGTRGTVAVAAASSQKGPRDAAMKKYELQGHRRINCGLRLKQ